jgi:HEAT repeat protein
LSQSLWTLIGEFNSTSSLKHSIDDGLVKSLLEKLIGFLQNELLQNSALLNLSKCISSFLCIKSSSASFKNIFDLLMKSAAASKNHFMLRCSAICMANLISSSPQDVRQTVDFFVKSIQSGNLSNQALALLVISELAKTSDLSFSEKLEAYVHNALSSPDEIVRLSAATCLGGITSGNLGRYLVALLKKLEEATVSGSLYLLMNAVKETISISQRSIYPFLNDLLRVILGKISVSDETIQLIIAECLGRLLHVSAEQVLPVLERLVNSASPADRFVSVSAVKYVTNLEVSFLKRINFSIFFDHIIDSDLVCSFSRMKSANLTSF